MFCKCILGLCDSFWTFKPSQILMKARTWRREIKGCFTAINIQSFGLCCSADYWSVWAFFYDCYCFSTAWSSCKCGVGPCCVLLTLEFVINDGVCRFSTVPITAFYLLCISKYFAILEWTWALQPYETPVNMSLALWECFFYNFHFSVNDHISTDAVSGFMSTCNHWVCHTAKKNNTSILL